MCTTVTVTTVTRSSGTDSSVTPCSSAVRAACRLEQGMYGSSGQEGEVYPGGGRVYMVGR